jgi:hypothetical protein
MLVDLRRLYWLRMALRVGGLALGAGLGLALLRGESSGLTLAGYLLTATTLPLLWPHAFGRWLALVGMMAAALAPLALFRTTDLSVASPWLDAAMLLQLTAWLMLPVTLALLLWRRRAAAAVILLGMALLPVSTLLLMQIGPPPTSLTTPPPVHPMVGMAMLTPFWLMLTSCTLGPMFFIVMFVWLLMREAIGEGEARRSPVQAGLRNGHRPAS